MLDQHLVVYPLPREKGRRLTYPNGECRKHLLTILAHAKNVSTEIPQEETPQKNKRHLPITLDHPPQNEAVSGPLVARDPIRIHPPSSFFFSLLSTLSAPLAWTLEKVWPD
jgi:hypothetical protein